MNGQHTEFNRLLGLGNELLMARQGLTNSPLRIPQATLDNKQTDALEKVGVNLNYLAVKARRENAYD